MRQWSKTKAVPATSVVNGSTMLLDDAGNCIGDRHSICCTEPDFVRDFVTRFAKEVHAETERVKPILAALQDLAAVIANLEKVTDEDDGECNHIAFKDLVELGGQMLDLIDQVQP